jgi:hypothetical protein
MIDNVHAMGLQVPKFLVPADDNANRKLATFSTVPQAAIDKAMAMVEQRPLLTGNDLGAAELRDRVTYVSAYGPVPDEVDAFSSALRHSVLTAHSEVGRATLTVYEMAKRESKRPESADLRPHVADLKRLLSGRFGKKSKRQSAPQPTPSSPSAPTVPHVASAAGETDPVVTTTTKSQ